MPDSMYCSQRYTAQKPTPPKKAAQAKAARPASANKMVLLLLAACLVVAVLSVLLVPMLVGGTSPAASAARTAQSQPNAIQYESPAAAAQVLGITPALPGALPEGYAVTASRVVEDTMLEVEITGGRNTLVFRAALGNQDLSGHDSTAFAYTATQEEGGIARGYAGVSEKKLNVAVWVQGDYTYALVCSGGMEAAMFHQIAEGIG